MANNACFATLEGRVVADPTYKTASNGTERARFTVAVNRPGKKKDNGQTDADFIPVTMAGGQITQYIHEHLVKGVPVLVYGRPENVEYTDSNGEKKRFFSVSAENVQIGPMGNYNTVILQGNLTRDPELKQTPSGNSVCTFSVAVNRGYKASDGTWKEVSSFFTCTAWNGQAEFICRYFKKGSGMLVTGSLRSRSYEKDGDKRTVYEVLIGTDMGSIGFASYKKNSDDDAKTAGTSQKVSEKNKNAQAPSFSDGPYSNDDFELCGDDEDLPF